MDKRKCRERIVYLCLEPDLLFSSLLVSAAFIVWKWRPYWLLLHTTRADIFLSASEMSILYVIPEKRSVLLSIYII